MGTIYMLFSPHCVTSRLLFLLVKQLVLLYDLKKDDYNYVCENP